MTLVAKPRRPFVFSPSIVLHRKRTSWPLLPMLREQDASYMFMDDGRVSRYDFKTQVSEYVEIQSKEHLLQILIDWGFSVDEENLNGLYREMFLVGKPPKLRLA